MRTRVLRLFNAWLDVALAADDETYERLFAYVMAEREPGPHDGFTAAQIEATARLVRARRALHPDHYTAVQPLVETAATEAAGKLRSAFST